MSRAPLCRPALEGVREEPPGLCAPSTEAAGGLWGPAAQVVPAGPGLAPTLSPGVEVLLPPPRRGAVSVKQPGSVLFALCAVRERREECGEASGRCAGYG